MSELYSRYRRWTDSTETPTLTLCTQVLMHDGWSFMVVGAAIWNGEDAYDTKEGERWALERMQRAATGLKQVDYDVAAHIRRDRSPVAQVLTSRGFDNLIGRLGEETHMLPTNVKTSQDVLGVLRPRHIKVTKGN